MKSYDELKAEKEVILNQVVEMKKIKCANDIKQVKHLSNEFGFTARTLKGVLIEGRNIK